MDGLDSLAERLTETQRHVARLQEALKREEQKSVRLQLRCNQQGAELSRREQQCSRLKDRLLQLTDGIQNRAPDVQVLNLLPGDGGQRDTMTSSRCAAQQEEAVLRVVLERREAELREAMKLRHGLTSLLHALRVDMEQTLIGMDAHAHRHAHTPSRLERVEAELGDHVTGGVVQSWMKVQRKLQDVPSEAPPAGDTDHEKMVERLERELSESQQLVKQQQEMLQDSLAPPTLTELTDSYFLEEWDRLRVGWVQLESQRRTFDSERRDFTEAAIRLGRERCDFEEQKVSLLKRCFLSESPLKPKGATQSPTVVTPSRSGVPTDGVPARCGGGGLRSPSTPELYAALQLNWRVGHLDTWDKDTTLRSPQNRPF